MYGYFRTVNNHKSTNGVTRKLCSLVALQPIRGPFFRLISFRRRRSPQDWWHMVENSNEQRWGFGRWGAAVLGGLLVVFLGVLFYCAIKVSLEPTHRWERYDDNAAPWPRR